GSSFPALSVTVNVGGNAPASVTNVVYVAGGGETNPVNNSASDVIAISSNVPPTIKTLVGWDVSGQAGGLGNFGPSPLTPTTNAANLTVVGLTRGSGVAQVGTGALRGWGGTSFNNITSANAINSNQLVSFNVTATGGYQ